MKRLKLISGQNKQTLVFVNNIKYIRERNSTETLIKFDNENSIVVKMPFLELESKLNEL
jgi:competence transcription factor ComK